MEGNQLVADQVVARGESGWDCAGPLLIAANKLGNVPPRGGFGVEEDLDAVSVEASLVNLEPTRTRAIAGTEGTSTLVHPDQDWSLAVCPLSPDSRDAVAWLN